VPLIDDFGVDTHVASPNLAGWLRVTAAAISFPGGVERSHTQKRWRLGNAFSRKSLHIPSSVSDQRCAVGSGFVGLTPRPTERAEVVKYDINVILGYDRRHDATS
jgi:hypothetical protein